MLPDCYHPHDKAWILEQVKQIPWGMRKKAVLRYSEVYSEALESSDNKICPEGNARKEANTRLRAYVERAVKVNNGVVSMPPRVRL